MVAAQHPQCRLYLLTPPRIDDLEAFAHLLAETLEAGDVAALQIRLKDASDEQIAEAVGVIRPIANRRGLMTLLNDRPDLAKNLGCDGVHVGQGDMPYAKARAIMGPEAVIGITCHDSLHLAMDAAEAGADYVAFGAFFPTETKETTARPEPDLLTGWQADMLIPCVAIGGITVKTAKDLTSAGADYLAVMGGVWNYAEGAAAAIRAFNREIAAGVAERRAKA